MLDKHTPQTELLSLGDASVVQRQSNVLLYQRCNVISRLATPEIPTSVRPITTMQLGSQMLTYRAACRQASFQAIDSQQKYDHLRLELIITIKQLLSAVNPSLLCCPQQDLLVINELPLQRS